ncbi:hypothetical protein N1851_028681 [Merluccius polli]|uniref:Uncharacterized protein n=1 Tax=Merluccius polli TaxID=89951 RepID=A0AA47NS78_MERPO|nr:hypothetical protein N1851_028681 [Merluccius polli]
MQGEVPERCSVPIILRFLQDRLETKLAVSILRVYIAAISAQHVRVGNQTVGSHSLVTRFLKGAQRQTPYN